VAVSWKAGSRAAFSSATKNTRAVNVMRSVVDDSTTVTNVTSMPRVGATASVCSPSEPRSTSTKQEAERKANSWSLSRLLERRCEYGRSLAARSISVCQAPEVDHRSRTGTATPTS
jgi:hypothetical protein